VSVFDNRLNVPVVRWISSSIRAISQHVRCISLIRDMPPR
jgi:hypothetical protein